jgi:hypothetical protein
MTRRNPGRVPGSVLGGTRGAEDDKPQTPPEPRHKKGKKMKIQKIKSETLSILAAKAKESGGHMKIKNDPYMDLSVECLGEISPGGKISYPAFSLTHYGEQNGDLMKDPDMVFLQIIEEGKEYFLAYEFQNDYAGFYDRAFDSEGWIVSKQREMTDFARMWLKNIKDQGFLDQLKPAGTTA